MATAHKNPFYLHNTKIISIYLDSDSHFMCIMKNSIMQFDLYCATCTLDLPHSKPHYSDNSFQRIIDILISVYMKDKDEYFYNCVVEDIKYIDNIIDRFYKIENNRVENNDDGTFKKQYFDIVNVKKPKKQKYTYIE
jgi:hypothetical protein